MCLHGVGEWGLLNRVEETVVLPATLHEGMAASIDFLGTRVFSI